MTEPAFDHTPQAERRAQRLKNDLIGWLATVRPDGRPHLVPVWFLWSENRLVLTAEPVSQKIVNLRANAQISFALDDSKDGHEPVIFEGTASIEATRGDDPVLAAYYRKYAETMEAMNWLEADARAAFTAKITIEIGRVVEF